MKLKYVEDYYSQIKERFPDLEIWEIEKILKHGFRSFAQVQYSGGDVLIKASHDSFSMYFGKLFNYREKFNKYADLKRRIKIRIKYYGSKPIWDGSYYFGLTEEEYEKYIPNKKGRKLCTLENVKLYKIKEEALLPKRQKYFFKLTGEEDQGACVKKEKFSTRNISLIATRNSEGKIEYVND